MYVDTHSHIYGEEFDDDRAEVVQRALACGVQTIILPDIDAQSRQMMFDLASTYPKMLKPCLGLHPTSVNADYLRDLKALEHCIGLHPCYAIGECGLDFYWDKTFQREQVKALEYQMNIAKESKLPIIIHTRDALSETMDVLRKYPDVRGVLHCFCGNEEQANEGIAIGYKLGIGGVVTFKNSGLDKTLAHIGLEHLVLETDSPYLSPVPYRGKRNESANVVLVARKLAEIYGKKQEEIALVTTKNALNLFGITENEQNKEI